MTAFPSTDDMRHAHDLIASHIRKTPVFAIDGTELGLAGPVSLKLELLQHSGTFKPRGAFYNLLSRDVPEAGVAAASGGNHGAAVAYAARKLGIKARIFVPDIASPAKIARIRSYGAEIVVKGERYADALELCSAYQTETGAIGLHAYDGFHTICGQGTLGLELEQQMGPDLPDTLLVAVGGGGLISGIASWFDKRVKVIGVEPNEASALAQALAAGGPVDVPVSGVAADSLGAKRTGDMVYQIARDKIDHVLCLDDEAILEAQKTLWTRHHLATEAGGATAFAALLSGAYKPEKDERVGVVLCGSNVDLDKLATLTSQE
ncbi:threonine/serine dehydratase [Cohaesibacter sp. CAU 1516]|uniref:threonine/serine dehydratase n=1 Tax=Cohaesibacter sp. CAU 1516 TaxID=2576038 RepID=UPI0010FDDD12|nr:threonine/serine dehydratase [Cohaesibacter sp. CAU 1516]TLP46943.1 threonine/serine dehydratase [Cohaesibacter sp. CAU 1516]